MPSLRDYRDRISSVKSTKKITSAMKMVAASKLRKAQEQAEAAQPYAQSMADVLERVAANVVVGPNSSPLLAGTGSDQKHLLVVVTADRGLCGGFNAALIKEARKQARALIDQGKDVSIICVGRKGDESLGRDLRAHIEKSFINLLGSRHVEFSSAQEVTTYILDQFAAGAFDICTLFYNEFKSVLAQTPVSAQLIPFALPEAQEAESKEDDTEKEIAAVAPYDFEPEEEQILNTLLPHSIGVRLFQALLDSAAGEQAARMTAMDNATRNAGEMIGLLTLQYNRARQAYITKELIEIISGAEAL